MKVTEENEDWAAEQLRRFQGWKGFPETPEAIASRVRSFLRLVHNKPAREIMRECCRPDVFASIDWEAKGIDPDMTDLEWILGLIEETMDHWPLPVEIREIYSAQLKPATAVFGEVTVPAGENIGAHQPFEYTPDR